jgi:hypothetical protein
MTSNERRAAARSLALAALSLSLVPACGLEACLAVGDFTPTPPPQATVSGTIDDLPSALLNRGSGADLVIEAISVDGAVIAETRGSIGESFTLNLGEVGNAFNVRVVITGGELTLKALAPEAQAGRRVELGSIGTRSTAATLVAERYAERERNDLASTPPATLAQVYSNAGSDESAQAAFRDLVFSVLDATDPALGDPAFASASYTVRSEALEVAGIQQTQWDVALEAAVDASLVPVVCDPSQIRVMFTVDTSGQGKDGNGATQFIRQPNKEGKVFLGITLDPSSTVPDSAGTLKPRLTPNDPATEMRDDGLEGDELAGDGIFTITLPLPRGMRVLYKYTNGSPGEGFTGTEEWPGNARILVVNDVITGNDNGTPDCLVIRRDSFGDESSNKNFVNLHARKGGGSLGYNEDLGGPPVTPSTGEGMLDVGGLPLGGVRELGPLTPDGIAEARENGTCQVCPPPLTVSAEDEDPPRLIAAAFTASDRTRVIFSEDLDLSSGGLGGNYLIVDEAGGAVAVRSAQVAGSQVTLTHDPVDPRGQFKLFVKDVTDASLAQNPIADGASILIGGDQTPPEVVEVRPSSIVELNPSARPGDPETGEVVVLTFSEVLDRISAENADNYSIDGLEVLAAVQRGREVLLVTTQQARGEPYALTVGTVFDLNGNVAVQTEPVPFRGLSLSLVTFRVVPGHAWRSVDGADRGLPPGDDLYLTGTVMTKARGLDGADLRVAGRTDVAGIDGYRFEPTEELVDGEAVYELSLRMPPGTYAFKLAHGTTADAVDPPPTLETVTKNLCTRNDAGGVSVDPRTGQGKDGISYAGARLSLSGLDEPSPGILFKRENPDRILTVTEDDVVLPTLLIGTWRDVPFGNGADYDDGKVELPILIADDDDTEPPRLLGARARDSESVLLSFDEVILEGETFSVSIEGENGALAVAETLVGQPLPTQIVVRTGAMENDASYSLLLAGVKDVANNVSTPTTVGFTSPASFTPFTPIIDEDPPLVIGNNPLSPTELELVFNERLATNTVVPGAFSFSHNSGGTDPVLAPDGVRTAGAGRRVIFTFVDDMERQAPYEVTITGLEDLQGNAMDATTIPFLGFGEFDPPEIEWVRPVTNTMVAVKWNEPVTEGSAVITENYAFNGLTITNIRFGASDAMRNAAFNASWAPLSSDMVILTTTAMNDGADYTLTAYGVADLSGNESNTEGTFVGVGEAPTVDVILTYLISDSAQVVGVGAGGSPGTPGRAISAATLAQQREGVFLLGTALTYDGANPLPDHPFTAFTGGFPEEGAPLDGVELQLMDDGQGGDAMAGDNIYSVRITDVPLGSTLSWKAFASFDPVWAADNMSVPGAAFADGPLGPSVFGDGQEYPGNDNAVLLVADEDNDGVVEVNNLYGDEITFKRKTGFPAFHFVTDTATRLQ